jgi:hypothetical protein
VTRKGIILSAAGVMVITLAAGAGHLAGVEAAPSKGEAQHAELAAERSAMKGAHEAAFEENRDSGVVEGRQEGENEARADGRMDGAHDGAAKAEKQAAEEEAVLVDEPVCTDPNALPTPPGCPVPPDGLCGLYQQLYPDGSCGPKTPDPATPEECPLGWHPAGIYGACAPD